MSSSRFNTATSTIKAAITSIEIPKTCPTCICLEWKGDGFDDHSKFFHTCQGKIPLDHSFTFRASRNEPHCATLKLQSKSIHGEIVTIGQLEISVPITIFNGTANDSIFEIQTDIGPFKITISFHILSEKEDTNQESSYTQEQPNMTNYSNLVHQLTPLILAPNKPSDFWGPEGLRSCIEYLSNCKATEDAVNKLVELSNELHQVALSVGSYSQFLQQILLLLMNQPLLVDSDNKLYELNQDIDESIQVYPVLGVKICQTIEKHIGTQSNQTYLEMPLVDISICISHILKDPHTSPTELIYLLASLRFIICFIEARDRNSKYQTIISTYKVVEYHTLVTILTKIEQMIQDNSTRPYSIKTFLIQKHQTLLNIFHLPTAIWDNIYAYSIQTIDYYATSYWITNPHEKFKLENYTKQFPNAEFPYLTSIAKVFANPKNYLQKSNLAELKLQGNWLYQILSKAYQMVNGNDTSAEQVVDKLVKDSDKTTSKINIDHFILEHPDFTNSSMEIPVNLPNPNINLQ